ncbi:hypothetical protein ACFQ71_03050 [Streptomyces sp. NPDC056534]|uniref:hypothetical protein n=1 Tax=Streptomyces sp. NPDC056534 TaxID=3345857 RepID=UPI0036B4D15E
MALFNDHISVHRAPLVSDAYGKHRDWFQAVKVWEGLGAALPYRRSEVPELPTRETAVTRITVYLPGAIAWDSADRLLIRGEWWESDGDAWPWRLGSRRYTQLYAKKVTK